MLDRSAVSSAARGLPAPLRVALSRAYRALRAWLGPPLELLPDAPDVFGGYRALTKHPDTSRRPGGWEYKGRFYPDYLTVGGASHAIFRTAVRHCRGRGVDLGAGLWPLPGATAVDMSRGPGAGRTLDDFADGSLDFVFSSHCLEHVAGWKDLLARCSAKLRSGGTLFLYLPHPDCAIWHPGSPFVGNAHLWVPTPKVIREALSAVSCAAVASDDGPDAMQSFYAVGRKTG